MSPTMAIVSGERVSAEASQGKAMAETPFPTLEIAVALQSFQ